MTTFWLVHERAIRVLSDEENGVRRTSLEAIDDQGRRDKIHTAYGVEYATNYKDLYTSV